MDQKKILSLDAGASNVRCIIFNSFGQTIGHKRTSTVGNISINPEKKTEEIINLMTRTINESNLDINEINHFSLGLAGVSNDNAREMLFKKLDEKNISNKTHLSSDVNPIFEINCSDNSAILVNVGTGFICMGRDLEDKIIKTGGVGLENDIGSGYWIGKEVILNLSFSRNVEHDEDEFDELLKMTLHHFKSKELNKVIDDIVSSDEKYRKIASLSEPLLNLAKDGNEIALSIVQQSSQCVSEYIFDLIDQISYTNDDLLIIGNGGVLSNSFYRKSLSDAMAFDFNNIKWMFPTISTAYYPGLLSCKILGLDVNVETIIKSGEYCNS